MIDLKAMRHDEEAREQVKTFLTADTRAIVKAAAVYTNRPEYAIIEAAIVASVPDVRK